MEGPKFGHEEQVILHKLNQTRPILLHKTCPIITKARRFKKWDMMCPVLLNRTGSKVPSWTKTRKRNRTRPVLRNRARPAGSTQIRIFVYLVNFWLQFDIHTLFQTYSKAPRTLVLIFGELELGFSSKDYLWYLCDFHQSYVYSFSDNDFVLLGISV